MATTNSVTHKSGDWVYPDGYPCGATNETWDNFAKADGTLFRRFQIPFEGDSPLSATDAKYLADLGHEVELHEKPFKDLEFTVKRLIEAAKLTHSQESLDTVKEFMATQSGEGLPKLADFVKFVKAKHTVEGSAVLEHGGGMNITE